MTRDTSHTHDAYCGCPSEEVIAHQCRADIERVGWHCVGVRADIPFLYTVGLKRSYGHPELVVSGLPLQTGHSVLTAAVRAFTKRPLTDVDEQRDDILEAFPVRFAAVDPAVLAGQFRISDEFYGEQVPRYQLLWPDPAGRFPGDSGMDERMASVQDLTGLLAL